MENGNGENKFGLSRKTNVAIAAISGITLICQIQNTWHVLIGVAVVGVLAFYHTYSQSKIDRMKIEGRP